MVLARIHANLQKRRLLWPLQELLQECNSHAKHIDLRAYAGTVTCNHTKTCGKVALGVAPTPRVLLLVL